MHSDHNNANTHEAHNDSTIPCSNDTTIVPAALSQAVAYKDYATPISVALSPAAASHNDATTTPAALSPADVTQVEN